MKFFALGALSALLLAGAACGAIAANNAELGKTYKAEVAHHAAATQFARAARAEANVQPCETVIVASR